MSEILIIDDNLDLCSMLEELANRMGYDTVSRHTLADGLQEARDNPYDVVFLDVNLPDGNGLDKLPMIRNLASAPEVIIITGYGSEKNAEIAIKNGAWDYIQKTDSPLKTDIVCTKCGQRHTVTGLLNGTHCSNCQESLIKELF